MVPRGLQEREARPHRLRAPVRAHDVPGLGAPRQRLLPAPAEDRRADQRLHEQRPHELLGERAGRPARAGAVHGGRPHGLAGAGHDAGEARQPARRREEREAPGREPPLCQEPRPAARPHVRPGPSLLVAGHRQHGGPVGRLEGGRLRVLPPLLRAQQRLAVRGRRLRSRKGEGVDREVLRPDPARPSRRPPRVVDPAAGRRAACRRRGRRRGAAPVHAVALAGLVPGGRRRVRPAGRHRRRRQDVAAVQGPGLRQAPRAGRALLAGLARDERHLRHHRQRRARPHAPRARGRHRRRAARAAGRRRHRGRGGPGSHALRDRRRARPAGHRRLRRQGRPPQPLQRAGGQPGLAEGRPWPLRRDQRHDHQHLDAQVHRPGPARCAVHRAAGQAGRGQARRRPQQAARGRRARGLHAARGAGGHAAQRPEAGAGREARPAAGRGAPGRARRLGRRPRRPAGRRLADGRDAGRGGQGQGRAGAGRGHRGTGRRPALEQQL